MYKGAADAGRLASFFVSVCARQSKEEGQDTRSSNAGNTFCMRQ